MYKRTTPLKRLGDIDPGGVTNLSWAEWVIFFLQELQWLPVNSLCYECVFTSGYQYLPVFQYCIL